LAVKGGMAWGPRRAGKVAEVGCTSTEKTVSDCTVCQRQRGTAVVSGSYKFHTLTIRNSINGQYQILNNIRVPYPISIETSMMKAFEYYNGNPFQSVIYLTEPSL